MTEKSAYDVVVIGGGAAGLGGALALSRARRSVLVVDEGTPRNAPAEGVHNYLGREGTPPAELLAIGRAEVAGYGGELVTGTVRAGRGRRRRLPDRAGRRRPSARRKLLVAVGGTDELPDVPGLAERWGTTVLHCPYCHGYEVRDRAIGILGTGPMAMHATLLWRQWSADVTLFRNTAPELTDEEREKLAARGITVVEGAVAAIEGGADVRLASGELVPRDALVAASTVTARIGPLAGLGLVATPKEMNGVVVGRQLTASPTGETGIPGVYVAGNAADIVAQVMGSAANGIQAGAMINRR